MAAFPYYAYYGTIIIYTVPQLHDEMEIYISMNHNGNFLVQDTRYPLETGSLVLIHPFEIHYVFSSIKDHTERYDLRFPIKILERLSTLQSNLLNVFKTAPRHIVLSRPDLMKLCGMMEELIAPVGSAFGEDIQKTILLENFLLTLASILRHHHEEKSALQDLPDHTVIDTITYISAHYLESIHLDDIAAHLYVSKSRLCKIFKDHTGISIGDYMTMLRLQKACVLLKENTMMVRDVAAAVGFKSYPHFIRTFTNKIGMSPKKFVRESKK